MAIATNIGIATLMLPMWLNIIKQYATGEKEVMDAQLPGAHWGECGVKCLLLD